MVERSQNLSHESRFEDTKLQKRKQLESDFRGGNETKSVEAAHELASYFTEESFSLKDTIDGIFLGFDALMRGNKAGSVLLQDIAHYYQEAPVTLKTIPSIEEKNEREEMKRLIVKTKTRIKGYSNKNVLDDSEIMVHYVVSVAELGLKEAKKINHNQLPVVFISGGRAESNFLKDNPQVSKAYSALVQLTNPLVMRGATWDEHEAHDLYESVFSQLDTLSQWCKFIRSIPPGLSSQFDILNKESGEVSLQDIVDIPVNPHDYTSYNASNEAILSYLANSRRGDYLVHSLNTVLFNSLLVMDHTQNMKEVMGSQYGIVEKSIRWQMFMAEQLYVPTLVDVHTSQTDIGDLSEVGRNKDINTLISHYLNSLDYRSMGQLFAGITGAMYSQYYYARHLYEGVDASILYANAPISTLAIMETSMLSPDIAAIRLTNTHLDQIIQDITQRLDLDATHQAYINDRLQIFRLADIEKQVVEEFGKWMHSQMGDELLNLIRSKKEEIDDATDRIMSGEEANFTVWPDPRSIIDFEFYTKSAIRHLGIERSIWKIPERMDQPVNFQLVGEGGQVLIGTIDFMNKKIYILGENETESFSDICTLMRFSVACIAKDIFSRETEIIRRKDTTDVVEPQPEVFTTYPRTPLPRKRHELHHDDLLNEFQAEEPTDYEPSTRTPKWNHADTRRLPYGALLEAAIKKRSEFIQSESEYERWDKKVHYFRKKLGAPNMRRIMTKISKLAPAFALRKIPDPINPEKDLVIETWVRGHYSPALPEDADHPLSDMPYSDMYISRHRAGVSGMDFLSEVLESVVGITDLGIIEDDELEF